MLSDNLPEMAIGTSLKILEKEGLIARSHEKSGNAYLKLLKDFGEITDNLQKRSKKSLEMLHKLYTRFGVELENGWQANLEEVAEILETKKESLLRLIRSLAEKGLMEYKPPFKGTEIRILKRLDLSEVNIDFRALKEKLAHAYNKLDKMENYVYHNGCRQQYILEYFGDQSAKVCGKCDVCLTGDAIRAKAEPKKNYQRADGHRYRRQEAEEFIVIEPDKKSGLNTKLTQLETFELYNKGLSIKEMAKERDLDEKIIIEHLQFLIKTKLIKDNIEKIKKGR